MSRPSSSKRTRSSLAQRFTKKLASTALGSQLGRRLFSDRLPANIQLIIDAFKRAFTKHCDAAKARQINKDLLKLAIKVHLVVRADSFDVKAEEEPLYRVSEGISEFAWFLEEDCKASECKEKAQAMSRKLATMQETTCELFSRYISQKNVKKMGALILDFSDSDFLYNLGFEEKYKPEKDVIVDGMRVAVLNLSTQMASLRCRHRNCENTRARPEGKFSGSKFCDSHHYLRFHKKLTHPRLDHWLHGSKFFIFLEERKMGGHFKLLRDCEEYALIERAVSRRTRGLSLQEQLQESKTIPFELLNEGEARIKELESKELTWSKGLFYPEADFLKQQLQKVFADGFLQSAFFVQWVASKTLPAARLKAVQHREEKAQAKHGQAHKTLRRRNTTTRRPNAVSKRFNSRTLTRKQQKGRSKARLSHVPKRSSKTSSAKQMDS